MPTRNENQAINDFANNSSEFLSNNLILNNSTAEKEDKASRALFHANNLFSRNEIDIFSKHYRYGLMNPYDNVSTCREYLFFTKPDLSIIERDDESGTVGSDLNPVLTLYPFWQELYAKYPEIIACLQSSYSPPNDNRFSTKDPFNHLLSNMVQSNLDVPGLDSSNDSIKTPTNMYGVGYDYRGSSEGSDDTFDFSLEFKDNQFLPVYTFFKAYEEYQKLKHHGVVAPWRQYIERKILHDQFCIYKFIVGEDGETIIYYAKYYGVKSLNLPRDVFNTTSFDNGISYSVNFNAAFVEDMTPEILADFNNISFSYWNSLGQANDLNPIRIISDLRGDNLTDQYTMADGRPGKGAIVIQEYSGNHENGGMRRIFGFDATTSDPYSTKTPLHDRAPGRFVYKLKWRGDGN